MSCTFISKTLVVIQSIQIRGEVPSKHFVTDKWAHMTCTRVERRMDNISLIPGTYVAVRYITLYNYLECSSSVQYIHQCTTIYNNHELQYPPTDIALHNQCDIPLNSSRQRKGTTQHILDTIIIITIHLSNHTPCILVLSSARK